MDGIFKQKLLNLRTPFVPKTFGEALFKDTPWPSKNTLPSAKIDLPRENYTEKVQVIESLERFAQEKVKEEKSPVIKIDGGEIVLKPDPHWDEVKNHTSIDELKSSLKLDSKILEIILKNKSKGKIQVLFVSEKFRSYEEMAPELKGQFIDQLVAGFPLKTAELFERMILAMKLLPEEVVIYPVEGNDESDYSTEVMELAAYLRPEVVVTLGAKATNKILKSNDRLSLVHGQFFTRKSGDTNFQIVPLFHPSIIETNQNMKKTAWADMQKIMTHLKKLP